MKLNIFKYIILFLLGIIIIYHQLPIGDYSTGLFSGLTFLFFTSIFLFFFLIIMLNNCIKVVQKKQKIDFKTLIIFCFFIISFYAIIKTENEKFWTKEILVGTVSVKNSPIKKGTLKLYENGSFSATISYLEMSSIYQGNYTLIENNLKLERKNLSIITENIFSSEYIYIKKDALLQPIDSSFATLILTK